MSKVHFKVRAKFDRAGPTVEGTITLDRKTGAVIAKPLHSRRSYHTMLPLLADFICRMGVPVDSTMDKEDTA